MLTSMAGAAKEATAKVDAAIILSMVVFSLDILVILRSIISVWISID